MVKAGMTMSAVYIARKVKWSLFTVVNILKKYKTSGSVANKDRSGRPQKATPCGLCHLQKVIRENSFFARPPLKKWNQASQRHLVKEQLEED